MFERSVFAIVPARGGSKGLPHKNIIDLKGRPLISYTLRALNGSKLVSEYVVSTDDENIAQVAQQHGGRVPYLRSPELSQDDSKINDVVRDLLTRLEVEADYILLAQPTSPLRSAEDIDAALNMAYEKDADSVVSLALMETYHPWTMYYLEDDKMEAIGSKEHAMPRQQYPKVGWRNGAIYLVKKDVFLKQDTFVTENCVPYVMPDDRSVNIDSDEDLRLAEYYLNKQVAHDF